LSFGFVAGRRPSLEQLSEKFWDVIVCHVRND
jgi:hypothetical protein